MFGPGPDELRFMILYIWAEFVDICRWLLHLLWR
jgi:hypothetical protein